MTCSKYIESGLRMLDGIGTWLPGLAIRLLLAYEFWEAGWMKLHGENWFTDIQAQFPFPFNILSPALSWQLATWIELAGPVSLAAGLGTRLAAMALTILTIVAWYSVHAGNGYNVCDNGYQLPLMYLVLLAPLIFQGAGRLSIDARIRRRGRQIERLN